MASYSGVAAGQRHTATLGNAVAILVPDQNRALAGLVDLRARPGVAKVRRGSDFVLSTSTL